MSTSTTRPTNRDSLSSTSSFSSSRSATGSTRLAPGSLRVNPPDHSSFLPRPTSSLSERWNDGDSSSSSGESDAEEELEELEEGDSAWVDEDDDDEEDGGGGQQQEARQHSLFRSTTSPTTVAPLHRSDDESSDDRPSPPEQDATPPAAVLTASTPVTLSSHHTSYATSGSEEDVQDPNRHSFPSSSSSDEGAGDGEGGIGLGVGHEALSLHHRELRMRQMEDMRARAGVHAGRSLGFVEDEVVGEEQEWKEEVEVTATTTRVPEARDLVVEEERVDGLVGLGVGGSGVTAVGAMMARNRLGVPFPSIAEVPSGEAPGYELREDDTEEGGDERTSRRSRDLPPLPLSRFSTPAGSIRSPRVSNVSATTTTSSSDSSTLSLPHVSPVDLTLPNRPPGTFVSVASGPMGRLAADSNLSRSPSQRGPRAFLSNLLNRSPRSPNLSISPSTSPSTSPSLGPPPRSPSAPTGWQHPAISSAQRAHHRSSSLPSPDATTRSFNDSAPASSTATTTTEAEPPTQRRTPRSIAAATFSGLTRSASLRLAPSPTLPQSHLPSSQSLPRLSTSTRGGVAPPPIASPAPTIGFSTPPPPNPNVPIPPPQTLAEIGLSLAQITQPLSLSRNAQPLCGALLDNKYLLIGTTAGLDFLPLPLPGSLPMRSHGKKRKETRKPISLIKRTRFKDLAVLSERSNILLAIAGRNDHIRVYALDGIRSMIQKKMAELDARDGYPFIQDGAFLNHPPRSSRPPVSTDPKGKSRAVPSTTSTSASTTYRAPRSSSNNNNNNGGPAPFQFPAPSPPPDYTLSVSSPRSLRRPPSFHQPSYTSTSSNNIPSSPIRSTHVRTNSSGPIVRAVPTNPRGSLSGPSSSGPPLMSPRSLRSTKSKEFVASRRGSTATISRRKSRVEMSTTSPSSPNSRRSSVVSMVEPTLATMPSHAALRAQKAKEVVVEAERENGGGDGGRFLGVGRGVPTRRTSTASTGESGWDTDPSTSPVVPPSTQLLPRDPTPLRRSSTADLAEFIRNSGPDFTSPDLDNEEQRLQARLRTQRSASVVDGFGARRTSNETSGMMTRSKSTNDESSLPRSATTSQLDSRRKSNGFLLPEGDMPRSASLNDLPATSSKGLQPREATSPRLRQGEKSPVQDLTDFFRNSGPSDDPPNDGTAPPPIVFNDSGFSSTSKPMAREASTPKLQPHQLSPSMDLALLLRETGPNDDGANDVSPRSSPPLVNGNFTTLPPQPDILPRSSTNGFIDTLAEQRNLGPSSRPAFGRSTSTDTFPSARPRSAGSGASISVPRRSSVYKSDSTTRSASMEFPSKSRMLPRNPTTVASPDLDTPNPDNVDDDLVVPTRRRTGLTLSEVIRDLPPPPKPTLQPSLSTSSSLNQQQQLGVSPSSQQSHSTQGSPSNRASKRWTMGGLLHRGVEPGSSSSSVAQAGEQPSRPSTSSRTSSQWEMVPEPQQPPSRPPTATPTSAAAARPPSSQQQQDRPPSRSTPLPPHDFKRQASSSLHPQEAPTLPASSQMAPDAHPANSSSPLEYVKLARTKGARLLRAVETKKRTYLAVLCGDEGKRIELFTGSRSISLSLNRTFVLPENPRTIEFQLQGDDLVDIYLVYAESIFALEPATVRVREVGVGRGERRARRERERRMRDVAATNPTQNSNVEDSPAPVNTSTLHPADPVLAEETARAAAGFASLATGINVEGSPSPSPSPSRASSPVRINTVPVNRSTESEQLDSGPPPPQPTRAAPTSSRPPPPPPIDTDDNAPPVPPRAKSSLPYTSFQQLPFVPPVPSSILSSAWIIPPLYTDVVGSSSPDQPSALSPNIGSGPSILVNGDSEQFPDSNHHDEESNGAAGGINIPLLSPISLLGGAAHRANGPPGLFFVSKGKNLSGIVTAEGKSIIKRPLVWSLDKGNETDSVSDVTQRIEMLIVGGTKTVVVGVGSNEVKAIAVQGEQDKPPFGAAVNVTPAPSSRSNDLLAVREVHFLATHSQSSQLFYSERVGGSYTINVLSSKQ